MRRLRLIERPVALIAEIFEGVLKNADVRADRSGKAEGLIRAPRIDDYHVIDRSQAFQARLYVHRFILREDDRGYRNLPLARSHEVSLLSIKITLMSQKPTSR